MKIRNINDKWGDPVEFDSVEEMAASIELCGYDLPAEGLHEGVDYEVDAFEEMYEAYERAWAQERRGRL